MSLVRSAGLQGFRATVESLGGDVAPLAARAGVPMEALDHDEVLIDDASIAMILEIAAHELRCPDLGLRVAEAQQFSLLGPLSVAIQNSATLKDALDCTTRYMFVHAQNHSLIVGPDPQSARGVAAVQYSIGTGRQPLPQSLDMTLLFVHRAITFLVGGRYGLRSVALPHTPLASAARYEGAFGAPVRFSASEAALRLPASLLTRPLGDADAVLRQRALAFLSQHQPAPGPAVAPRVQGVLRQSLGSGSTDIEAVAGLLAVHPRTLQRHLAAEGETFSGILDGVRRTAAKRYLTTTDMPLLQVSRLLGFAEQAVLTRCARRWWGMSPTQLRAGGAADQRSGA